MLDEVHAASAWTECSVLSGAWDEFEIPVDDLVESGEYVTIGGGIIPVYEDAISDWEEQELSASSWTELEI